jgi:hypothetical protein
MPILRIEHPVPDFDAWKRAFDGDPIGRRQSGVRRYRILRPVDDPKYVMVDLEFDDAGGVRSRRPSGLVDRVQRQGLIGSPQARIADTVETKED